MWGHPGTRASREGRRDHRRMEGEGAPSARQRSITLQIGCIPAMPTGTNLPMASALFSAQCVRFPSLEALSRFLLESFPWPASQLWHVLTPVELIQVQPMEDERKFRQFQLRVLRHDGIAPQRTVVPTTDRRSVLPKARLDIWGKCEQRSGVGSSQGRVPILPIWRSDARHRPSEALVPPQRFPEVIPRDVLYALGTEVDGNHLALSDAIIVLEPGQRRHAEVFERSAAHRPSDVRADLERILGYRRDEDRIKETDSTLNRLRSLFSPIPKAIFNAAEKTIDFREIIRDRGILLGNGIPCPIVQPFATVGMPPRGLLTKSRCLPPQQFHNEMEPGVAM